MLIRQPRSSSMSWDIFKVKLKAESKEPNQMTPVWYGSLLLSPLGKVYCKPRMSCWLVPWYGFRMGAARAIDPVNVAFVSGSETFGTSCPDVFDDCATAAVKEPS